MGDKRSPFEECARCKRLISSSEFVPTKSLFYPSGHIPVCNACLEELVDDDWKKVDKICQLIDIPFVPERWEKLYSEQGKKAIVPYCNIFLSTEYEGLSWSDYQSKYKALREQHQLESEVIPGMKEEKLEELQEKWGSNYDEEELTYLENLFQGIYNTQNVNGFLQGDQVMKLCKISLVIDSRIREGSDIDKLLASYEKLVKIGEFTPKNAKNANDFDSVGEVFAYLEKTGFENKFYDGVKRDIVDITMANIQQFCQRLYTQEPGIGEDIDKRIESLKAAKEIEDSMGMYDDYSDMNVDEEFEEVTEEFDPEVLS